MVSAMLTGFQMKSLKTTTLALTAVIGAQSIILNAEAIDLLGWNKFHFGSSRDDVLRSSGDASKNAVLQTDGDLILYDLDLFGEDVQATFVFGSGGSDRYKAARRPKGLTSIELWGLLPNRECSDYEPHVEAGLSHQYGEFGARSKPVPPVKDARGQSLDIGPPGAEKSYELFKLFANHAYIFQHANSLNMDGPSGVVPQCMFYVTFDSAPPPSSFDPRFGSSIY